jgi:cell division protease FtsH
MLPLGNWEKRMNATIKTVIFWIVILFSAVVLWQVVNTNSSTKRAPEISYSQFLSEVSAGEVTRVRISRSQAEGAYRDGRSFRVIVPSSQEQMLATLEAKGVEIWYTESENPSPRSWLVNLLPLVLLAAFWFWMIRQMRAGTRSVATRGDASNTPPGSMG